LFNWIISFLFFHLSSPSFITGFFTTSLADGRFSGSYLGEGERKKEKKKKKKNEQTKIKVKQHNTTQHNI
jgi:hypothetical protein